MRYAVALLLAMATLSACVAPRQGERSGAATPSTLNRPTKKPPEYPKKRSEPRDQTLRQRAIAQIRQALASESPFGRANALEAAHFLPAEMAKEAVLFAVNDQNAVVRFAAMMTAGQMRMKETQPLAERLVGDPDRSVQAAAIFTLHRLGDTRYSRRLEQFAVDPDRRLRANTAMLLGLIGDKSAAMLLQRQMLDSDEVIRLQAAEGLWRLDADREALEFLVTATISRYPDDQIIAATGLAAPGNPRVAEHVRAMLTTDYAEVNLAAARGMGMLGFDEGYGVALEGAKSNDARQRQMAAMAFGAIGRLDAQQTLGRLLDDTDEGVRIAAADALLQLR